jgi:nitrate reductase NapAB chaperone NapD
MLKYPISTLLYLAKIRIKDKIQDALKLHDNIDIRLTITIKDKNGKIIKVHKQKSHSFLMNFLSMIAGLMVNPYGSENNYYYFLSTAGTWWSYAPNYTTVKNALTMLDGANDSSYGIVVGTGTATPTPNDYKLGSQITNGTGSGQLTYGSHTISPTPATSGLANGTSTPSSGLLNVSGNTTSFSISRLFTNNSGSAITVSEVGIIVEATLNSNNTGYVLILHDLLSSPVTIQNGGAITVTYTISVTT